jgi:hypothetical protein
MLLLSQFHQLGRNFRQCLDLRFDIRFVFTFQRSFQRAQSSFNGRFVVSWQFVTGFFNLLTGAVQLVIALVTCL